MSAFLVTADVEDHSPEQFLVEAETPAAATGAMLAWLEGHAMIRMKSGQWVPSGDVSRALSVAVTHAPPRLTAGGFLIDGRAALAET